LGKEEVRKRSCYSSAVKGTRGQEMLEEEAEMKEIKLDNIKKLY